MYFLVSSGYIRVLPSSVIVLYSRLLHLLAIFLASQMMLGLILAIFKNESRFSSLLIFFGFLYFFPELYLAFHEFDFCFLFFMRCSTLHGQWENFSLLIYFLFWLPLYICWLWSSFYLFLLSLFQRYFFQDLLDGCFRNIERGKKIGEIYKWTRINILLSITASHPNSR